MAATSSTPHRGTATATGSGHTVNDHSRTNRGAPVTVVLVLALILRLLHLGFAVNSPLTFQLGPDEDYYLQFAGAILDGSLAGSAFGFMDPLYAYILALVGRSPFLAYVLQILVDTSTVYAVILAGRKLGNPGAGLLGGLLYAVAPVALLFSTSLLKATFVAALLSWWLVLAVVVIRSNSRFAALSFGLLLGFGITLRANLALLALMSLLIFPWFAARNVVPGNHGKFRSIVMAKLLLIGGGLLLPLSLAALHYKNLDGRGTILPGNGGIVLHQLYNPDNPSSLQFAPDFVAYRHPGEIWSGYHDEASRRAGRELTATQTSAYWRDQAIDYIAANPATVAIAMFSKAVSFTAYTEVPNNRSFGDEQRFSPVLRWLPPLSGLLVALGVPGLILMARNREARLIWLPFLSVLATFIVFFAESRFRFHAMPLLALASGYSLVSIRRMFRDKRWNVMALLLLGIASFGVLSLYSGLQHPAPDTNWKRVSLGYLRINDLPGATDALSRWQQELAKRPNERAAYHETRGILALYQGDALLAERESRQAVLLSPSNHVAWHNLAVALNLQQRSVDAIRAAQEAAAIHPHGDYLLLLASLQANAGQSTDAIATYQRVLASPDAVASPAHREQAQKALAALDKTAGEDDAIP